MRFIPILLAPLLAVSAHAATLELCHEPDYGNCESFDAPQGQCQVLRDDWKYQVRSIRLLSGNNCSLCSDRNCNRAVGLIITGHDISDYNGGIVSFDCVG